MTQKTKSILKLFLCDTLHVYSYYGNYRILDKDYNPILSVRQVTIKAFIKKELLTEAFKITEKGKDIFKPKTKNNEQTTRNRTKPNLPA